MKGFLFQFGNNFFMLLVIFWIHEWLVLSTSLQVYAMQRLLFRSHLRLMLRSVLSLGRSVLVRGLIVDIFFISSNAFSHSLVHHHFLPSYCSSVKELLAHTFSVCIYGSNLLDQEMVVASLCCPVRAYFLWLSLFLGRFFGHFDHLSVPDISFFP